MKKFQNVNSNQFVSITTKIKNNINYNSEKEIISSIDNNSIWDSEAKKNLRGNLSMFILEYQKLSKNIFYLSDIAIKVKEYNELANQIEILTNNKKQLESMKWIYTYINGIEHKSINPDIAREINRLRIEISNKKIQLRKILIEIKNLNSKIK